MARITLGYGHYAICNDDSQPVTTSQNLNGCKSVSCNNSSFSAHICVSVNLQSFPLRSFCPFLCLRGKNSLRLSQLSAKKCQFPHICRTVASAYDITAVSLTLCTVTASFSTLYLSRVLYVLPLLGHYHLLLDSSMVSPHLLFLSLQYFVSALFCVILCDSVPCNMPPCGWGEMF